MVPQFKSRQDDRYPVELSANCRSCNGLRDEGWITDISPHGCRVRAGGLFVQVGMRVTVRPAGLEALLGTVRWIEGVTAGIEFDSPLYPPVVAHIAARHAPARGFA